MKKITEAGWKKAVSEKMTEKDIKALFDMIDKDKSGSLSKRVKLLLEMMIVYLILSPGSKKSC